MQLYVGVTDKAWFDFLAARAPEEVNFWRPSGTAPFRALQAGAPFLFKLHSPFRAIAGGAFFVSYSVLPLSLAWQTFGEKNGAPDFKTFHSRILRYRGRQSASEPDPAIGCIVLTDPFFFAEAAWVPEPEDWAPNLVQGKRYDTAEPIGAALWQQVKDRLQGVPLVEPSIKEERAEYGAAYLTHARLGQGAFRVLVTDAYQRRCAITGERTLPVLQAGHIKPFAESGPNQVSNGLLLRADLHILFDRGYLTVNPDFRVEVSQRIKEEYANGREYYALHGRPLAVVPATSFDRPGLQWLEWHNQHVFVP